jgi:hypothetical protein
MITGLVARATHSRRARVALRRVLIVAEGARLPLEQRNFRTMAV